MNKPLHLLTFLLALSVTFLPSASGLSRSAVARVIVDDEYDSYKKKGDDFYKAGFYTEARRQYQNCLEVPGFENDAYAKGQITKCTTGLNLRQQADEALRQGKGPEAVRLFGQLLSLNPGDSITKGQLADYYEGAGNQLFNLNRYAEAKSNYLEAFKYATATKKESLLIQVQNIDKLLKPSGHIGLKLAAGAVVVGAGVYAYILRNNYHTKLNALNQISQTADPTGSGTIDNPDMYRQYNDAYTAAEAAQQKNGLFKACLGVAAVAAIAEAYLWVHKPKTRMNAVHWQPSSQSIGLAISYTF